jgi:hypothetical protein
MPHLTPQQKQCIVDCYLRYSDPETGKIGSNFQTVLDTALPDEILKKNRVCRVMKEYRQGKENDPCFMFKKASHGGGNLKRTHAAVQSVFDILHDNKKTPTSALPALLTSLGHPMCERTAGQIVHDECDRHKESLNPKKSRLHEIQRMKFVCDEVDEVTEKLKSFNNQIHGDEKRFALHKDGLLYHWPKGEPLPDDDEVVHKNYIGWVMVLIVVAKPRWVRITGKEDVYFDGRIGCYAVTKSSIWVRGVEHERQRASTAKRYAILINFVILF